MNRTFNVSADCKPELHYMVDIRPKLEKIRAMIDQGQYFTINRARQYGKTTTLRALARFLKDDYVVVSLDFQMMSYACFEEEGIFVETLADEIVKKVRQDRRVPDEVLEKLKNIAAGNIKKYDCLFYLMLSVNGVKDQKSLWCC